MNDYAMRKLVKLIFPVLCLLSAHPTMLRAQTRFVDVTEQAGINHRFKVYEGMFGGGICVFDMDKDGYEDLYITGGMNEDVLYRNNGNGTFSNVYQNSGLEVTQKYVTQGVAGADVNRDGWVDLYITTITEKDSLERIPRAVNLLFLNNGDNTFRNETDAYGLREMRSFSTGASFGDFNADGYPDLYVGNYFRNYEGELTYINDATIVSANQTSEGYLLRNEKGKGFRDVYKKYGLSFKGYGFGGVFTDYDNDNDQDLIVNHDFGYKATPNFLFNNLFPRQRFEDQSKALDMDLKINSMSAAVGDFDNNGWMDYFFTNIRFNYFMVNQGPGKPYVNKAKSLGMNILSISWGANFADFDHDGDLDLYVSNGDLNPNDVPMGDFFFENTGNTFVEKGRAVGLSDYGIGRGSVIFDIENDGDMDILVVNQEPVLAYPVPSYTRLFRNDSTQGNWVKISLQGTQSESHGLGSRITVVAGGRRMIREIDGGGSSHLSQNSTIAHFGLGSAEKIDSLIVHWSAYPPQILVNQPVNTTITVVEEERPLVLLAYIPLIALLLSIGLIVWLGWRFYYRRMKNEELRMKNEK